MLRRRSSPPFCPILRASLRWPCKGSAVMSLPLQKLSRREQKPLWPQATRADAQMFFSTAGRKTPERRVRARGLREMEARRGSPHALSQHRAPGNPQAPAHPPAPCRPRAPTRRFAPARYREPPKIALARRHPARQPSSRPLGWGRLELPAQGMAGSGIALRPVLNRQLEQQ